MYFMALAADYDGTIAHDGIVAKDTVSTLKRFKESGRKLLLVTGRELPDLKRVFPELGLFDKVVAENGALIYTPASEEEKPISTAPSPDFVKALKKRGVKPLSVGHCIVATWEPHQTSCLEVINDLGLELEIIFNKGAVMVLPSGVNKATGLAAALKELGLSPHNVVGIGDAENDHAFMRACGLSVAVANALPAVKDTADLVTKGERGDGVKELAKKLIKKDHDLGISRRDGIRISTDDDSDVEIWPTDTLLIAGSSGVGKSTLATALTERFVEGGYQFCIVDPEGDYDGLNGAVGVGDAKTEPTAAQAVSLLDAVDTNVILNMLAVKVEERPDFATGVLPELAQFRLKTARPHWLIVDEAHHLLPKNHQGVAQIVSGKLPGGIFITVHPDMLSPEALKLVTAVVAIGPKADDVIAALCKGAGIKPPAKAAPPKDKKRVLFWRPGTDKKPRLVKVIEPKQSLKRHSRKYAEGTLDEKGSFYFRGPDNAMKLRAQNLMIFQQIAEGIDDKTWEHHLRKGDYSDWFRNQIRDKKLAAETREAEKDEALSPRESRKIVLDAVRKRYTAPANAPDEK
jgi:hydroxymethylpyrimidine pyrophosphatase-like HAD family hydrolase/energy-coupling factor transporter ATP-binding protein EcfA2